MKSHRKNKRREEGIKVKKVEQNVRKNKRTTPRNNKEQKSKNK